MIYFSFKTSKNYSMEFNFLHFYRNVKDGLTFLESDLSCDLEGDHTPRVKLFIGFMNLAIIDFSWHNVNHEEDKKDHDTVQIGNVVSGDMAGGDINK